MSSVENETQMPKVRVSKKLRHASFQSDGNQLFEAVRDVLVGVASVRLWWGLAWHEFLLHYKRSYIGAAWAVLSFIVFALAILFLVAAVRDGIAGEYSLYVLFGFLSFQLISNMINDGSKVFINSQQWIKSVRMPLSLFVMRGIARSSILFFFNCVGAGFILIYFGYVPPDGAHWAVPGLFFCLFTAFWVYLLLGTLVARFRDLGFAVEAVMRMAFFITPIIWFPPEGGFRGVLAAANPLTHFIALMRDPLLFGTVPSESWIIAGGVSAFLCVSAVTHFTLCRRRIILWL